MNDYVILIAKNRKTGLMIKNIIVKMIRRFDCGCGVSSNPCALPNYSENHK